MAERPYILIDEFNSTHYNGLDMTVIIDGIFIDELVQFVYKVSQPEMPLVNWNSFTVNSWGCGTRMIAGQLAINLRAPEYIRRLLKGDYEDLIATKPSKGTAEITYATSVDGLVTLGGPNLIKSLLSKQEVQQSKLLSANDGEDPYRFTNAGYFEESYSTNNKRVQHKLELILGAENSTTTVLRDTIDSANKGLSIERVDTLSRPGEYTVNKRESRVPMRKIVFTDVKFTEQSIAFTDDGKPAMQVYSWVARDCS